MKDQFNLQDVMKTSTNVLKLIKNQNLNIRQVNGQSIVNGPPIDWEGPPPDPRCEIFVGKIPRDIYEDELYGIFVEIGRIYKMRLMMDFSGNTRGYCFVMYSSIKEADLAIKYFNNFEITPGRRIVVVRSINNCRLCIAQLPSDIPSIAIIRKICSITDEVETVSVYRTYKGRARYALINYKSHRGAALGRRRLVPERTTLFGNSPVTVDWAHPAMQPSNAIEDIGSTDKNGEVNIKTSEIGGEEKRMFTPISRNRKETLDNNIKTYVQEDMSLPLKPINKTISTPSRSNSSQINNQIISRPLDLSRPKIPHSFNLFDNFTFSLSNPPQEEGSTGSLELVRMGSQNGFVKENWVDELTPRFSNMSLLPEEGKTWMADPSKLAGYSTLLQDKGSLGQYGNVGSCNQMNPGYQPIVWPEKGFPFHPPVPPFNVLPNGVPFVYTQIPGICVIPPQSPFVESWPIDNRAYSGFNQHHYQSNTCAGCFEGFAQSNTHRMPETCNSTCYNQSYRLNEAQLSQYEERLEDTDYELSEQDQAYQNQAAFRNRKQKSKTGRKTPVMKVLSRRRNHSGYNEVTEERTFACKTTQSEPIPKGARPILSAKK